MDTSKRDVIGDNLKEDFSSTITYSSDGILYMGSNADMAIKSINANINMNTGGVINLNGPAPTSLQAGDATEVPGNPNFLDLDNLNTALA